MSRPRASQRRGFFRFLLCCLGYFLLAGTHGAWAQDIEPAAVEALSAADAAPLDLATYEEQLGVILEALRQKDWRAARGTAAALRGRPLSMADDVGPLTVDGSWIAVVEGVDTAAEGKAAVQRLEVLRQELSDHRQGPNRAAASDHDLLRSIGEEQRIEVLRAAGGLPDVDVPAPILRNRFTLWLGDAMQWLGAKLERLVEWLFDQWRSDNERQGLAAKLNARLVTFMMVLLVLLIAWLAFRWLQGGRAVAPSSTAMSETIASQGAGDDNPLSREGDEWQRYAQQLAAAGRLREAIRAWYHAVLVNLYRGGLLHYRKGRTNWEYVAALHPQLRWRSRFIELTRHFETEWYGRGASSEDSLERCRRNALEILEQLRRGAPS